MVILEIIKIKISKIFYRRNKLNQKELSKILKNVYKTLNSLWVSKFIKTVLVREILEKYLTSLLKVVNFIVHQFFTKKRITKILG